LNIRSLAEVIAQTGTGIEPRQPRNHSRARTGGGFVRPRNASRAEETGRERSSPSSMKSNACEDIVHLARATTNDFVS
jgi:hypothetical protein